MSITVGEVNALLTVRDEATAQLKVAQQGVKDLEAAFAGMGTMSAASMQSAEKAHAKARAEVEKIQASMQSPRGGIADLGEKTDKTSSTMGNFATMVDKVVERMLIYASIRGVISAIEGTISWGLELERLSIQTGLSVQAIQELNYAAIQTSVPLTTVTQAISQMERKIDMEDTGLRQALKKLGLDFEAIRHSTPEAAFDAIAAKMKNVTDQFDFAGDAAQIFNSRSGSNIAAVIKNWDDLKTKAEQTNVVLGTDEVEALAKLSRAWEEVTLKAKVYFAQMLVGANTIPATATVGANAQMTSLAAGTSTEKPSDLLKREIDAQIAAMSAAAKLPGLAQFPGLASGPSLGDDRLGKERLSEIRAEEKLLTDQVHQRMEAEKALAAFEAVTNKDRLKQLSDEYKANEKIEETINKANNTAEESARANVLGKYGQKIDPNTGNPMRIGEDNPTYQLQQTLDRLKNSESSQMGSDRDRSTAFQQQDAIDKYTQSQYDEAIAADKAAAALARETDAVGNAAKAHGLLKPSLDAAAAGFSGFSMQISATNDQMRAFYADQALHAGSVGTGGLLPAGGATVGNLASGFRSAVDYLNTNPSAAAKLPGFADGGPTSGGPAMLHPGEFVVPQGGALVSGGVDPSRIIAMMQSYQSDQRQPFGYGSVELLQKEITALTAAMHSSSSGAVGSALSSGAGDLSKFLAGASTDLTRGPGGPMLQQLIDAMKGITVVVQGNVYTMDAAGKAAFAASVSDAVSAAMRQGRKLGSA